MKKIITYGTFDLFHVGHVRLLSRIADLGDHLTVACSTDSFNSLKGKKCIFPYEERKEILESCTFVDKVIPENNWEQKPEDIKEYNIDTFIMGSDWSGKFDYLQDVVEVLYLPRTENISSTDVKNAINSYHEDRLAKSINSLEAALKQIKNLRENC